MKMTRRDFLKLSSAAAAACGVTLLPAQKADAASAHPDPAGRSLSLRLPAGARGRHQDRLHQHEDRFRQPRPRQPVHPRPEAAGRFQPHGRQPQCGHHLHAGVAGRQRRASNLRRARGRPLFQRAGTGRMDEHRRRAGSTPGPTPSPTRAGRARCPRASGASTFPPGRSGPSPASCSPGRTTCRTWRRFRAGCS